MIPHPWSEPSVYRPLLKYRASAWAQAAMYIGLGGFVATLPVVDQPGWVSLLLAVGCAVVALFGLVVLLTVETLRLEVSPGGVAYRNGFGRVEAAPGQVEALEAVRGRPVLLLDRNCFRRAGWAFWVQYPPYSDGTYIPLHLFLDRCQDRAVLEQTRLGQDLLVALPELFEPDLPEVEDDLDAADEPELEALPPEATPELEGLPVAGNYRLRSRSSLVILAVFMLAAPFLMALAGLWSAQAVLLPGLLGGWMLTLLLGASEVRFTVLTDLIGLGVVALLGGLAALFLLGGCAFFSAAAGCSTNGFRANLFAFFFYPFVMYLIPWLLLYRLPRLLRRK